MRDLCVHFLLQLCSPNAKLVLLRSWRSFFFFFFLHSTNVPVDDNNMGLRLRDNTMWSGSAADGCACGWYKQRECQNNPQTSKESRSKGEKVGKKICQWNKCKRPTKVKNWHCREHRAKYGRHDDRTSNLSSLVWLNDDGEWKECWAVYKTQDCGQEVGMGTWHKR